MELSGRRVVITGGAGFVGSHLVDALLREDVAEVVVLDNLVRGREANLRQARASGRLRVITGDIRDRRITVEAIHGADLVFHQAALRITQCAEDRHECTDVMIVGTQCVLDAALEAGVSKIVFASSASVYGAAHEFPTPEEHHPYGNQSLYGAAKLWGEQVLASYWKAYELDYVALRYFNVYGPRMDVHGRYTEVMIRWLDALDRGESLTIYGDGSQTMDFVYVEDVARANILAAKTPVSGEIVNVGSGRETSLRELAELMMEITGVHVPARFVPNRSPVDVPRRLASVTKAEEMLGFRARVDLREGLSRLVTWRRDEMVEV